MELSDLDICATQFALEALRAIAARQRIVGETIEPISTIRDASALAKEALRRFSPVANKIMDSDIQPTKNED